MESMGLALLMIIGFVLFCGVGFVLICIATMIGYLGSAIWDAIKILFWLMKFSHRQVKRVIAYTCQ